jgi:hypothetical protein
MGTFVLASACCAAAPSAGALIAARVLRRWRSDPHAELAGQLSAAARP